jgi:hypothetical protein
MARMPFVLCLGRFAQGMALMEWEEEAMESNAALALVPRNSVLPSANDWNTMMTMGETLFKSGVLPEHIRNAAAVVAIVQKGKELGIPPMHALQNIAFIKGKTTLQAELMLALVIRDEGAGALRVAKTDNTGCTVAYRRAGNEGEYTFTIEDARAAGLVQAGGMYTKYPAAMLRSRCISAVCRFVFPDIIGGMYTQEEMGATVSEEGEVLALPADAPMRASVAPQPSQPAPSSLPVTRGGPLGSTGKATAGEIQFLWTMATKCGVSKDEVRNLLASMFPEAVGIDGTPSTRELTSAQVAQLVATIEPAEDDEEPVDEYAEIAAATDQGVLLDK